MTFFFDEIMGINLKNCRMLIVGVDFEEGFKIFDFEEIFLIKEESYLLKY